MKQVAFLIFLLLTLSSIKSNNDPSTTYTDPASGTKYDFSGLKRDPR
jgi:hypothetical protein